MLDIEYDKLMQYALHLLARKRYAENELKLKLKRKKIGDKKACQKVIGRLKELKYIDDFEKVLKKGKITCIEVPFKSGSNRILKLMHRYNDVEKMKKIFKRLNSIPNVSIKTHAIIGFPTETWDDLKQTINFIKDVDVKEGMFFKYSCKTGTESEELNPKVPPVEIKKRAKYVKKKLKNFGYHVFHRTVNVYLFYKNKDMIK